MTDKPDTTREAVERLIQESEACSRKLYGRCTTLSCLRRGGWKPGMSMDLATYHSLDVQATLRTLATEVAALRQAVERARREELEACAVIADQHRRDTSLLLSNPPQSAAAWAIAQAIRTRINLQK
jgi:hypothetical protein